MPHDVAIAEETPRQQEVIVLLRESDAYSDARYPPESQHLVDVDALALPTMRFFVARHAGEAVGCGAVRRDGHDGEIKRMFVSARARGLGIGRAILRSIETAARRDGIRVLRLETGTRNDEALSLYRREGFAEIGPFGGYGPDPLSVFMEKRLSPSSRGRKQGELSMANVYASIIVDAPVEAVWPIIRDFNGLPNWIPGLVASSIEGGRDADTVGSVRRLQIEGGATCSERLLALDDSRYLVSYGFVDNLFPIAEHRAVLELIPVTDGNRTFVQWSASFRDLPGHEGETAPVMEANVFVAGLAALAAKCKGAAAPAGAVRWDGWRPAKVFCSSVINGPVPAVWDRIRDFIGMGGWHPEISDMKMIGGVRSDKIGGVRDFQFGDGRITERLTYLNDADHAFRYTIEQSPMPWLNYHAGVNLYPVSADNRCFAVWTADWTASPNDDATLIPQIHDNVFQKAFNTLNERYFAR